MKLDILAPFAFLTYYRYSFFCIDFLLFGLFMYSFYHLAYKTMVPEKNKQRFELLRSIVSVSLALQFITYLLLIPSVLFSSKSVFVHAATSVGISGYIFVLFIMIRFFTIVLVSSFLASSWFVLNDENKKTTMLKNWYAVVVAILCVFTFNLCYLLFPSLNTALPLFEWFYNVRNLFIIKSQDRVQKTRMYIAELENMDGYDNTLFEDEWKRTFMNDVPSHDKTDTTPSD